MAKHPQVIVVGAGPVGLLTALALAKLDVSVLVLEAEPGLTVDLRAGTFHPPSLEMMAPYGITEAMHRTAIPVPRCSPFSGFRSPRRVSTPFSKRMSTSLGSTPASSNRSVTPSSSS